jgi:RHS repeat-associated protein
VVTEDLRERGSLITTPTITKSDATLTTWLGSGTKSQRTQTFYDTPLSAAVTTLFGGVAQENLRNRVVSTTYTSTSAVAYEHATHYTYDILGNVKALIQEYPEFDSKRIDYMYDQLSGKVNMVAYQAGKVDRLYHRYAYDADLRIRQVETSRDSVIWDRDAAYFYYRHGPMSRMELGQDQVQGMDYAYTIQGWIKGVNSGVLLPANDGGKDGVAATSRELIGRDAFGYMLNYHNNDYKGIGTGVAIEPTYIGTGFNQPTYQLFNGNIQGMTVAIGHSTIPLMGYNFYYDQLNRLLQVYHNTGLTAATNTYSATTSVQNMKIDYDPNGNIKTLLRKVLTSGATMDQLNYTYTANTNKLSFVTETVAAATFANDIDNQTTGNYVYDAIGNLIKDNSEGIDTIAWNVYGKMTRIKKNAANWLETFGYDASGNRVKKDANGYKTYYIRDASGNVMATYKIDSGSTVKILQSQYLYGSSRLGEYSLNLNLTTATISATTFSRTRGQRRYELANHLGNVQVVVSDRKVQKDDNADGLIDYYVADIVSATDYYAFGAVMSDRSFNAGGYRYGFNGKENDNEVKGTGNQQDYGMRIYDPRIGKFLSVDPLARKYPLYTPYQFAANKPTIAIDIDGLEDSIVTTKPKTYSGIKYSIAVNKDAPQIGTVTFNTGNKPISVDLDGGDVYHPNDEGLDYNKNGGINRDSKTGALSGPMYGITLDANSKPIVQDANQRSPGYYVPSTSVTVHGYSDSDPERYIDAINTPYLAVSQGFLDATGAKWGDIGVATNLDNNQSVSFIIGDKKSSMAHIEMSYKMAQDLGIPLTEKVVKSYDGKKDVTKLVGVGVNSANVQITIYRGSQTNPTNNTSNRNGQNKGTNDVNAINQTATDYQNKLNPPATNNGN